MDVWCTVDTSAKCSGEGLRGTTEEKERREEVMYRPNVIPCSYSHVNSVVPELTRYTLAEPAHACLQLADGEQAAAANSTATVSVSGPSFVLSQKAADEVRDCHKM